jgi:hypothetical protein
MMLCGRELVTPPLDGRILPGITRQALLDIATELGYAIRIRPIALDELAGADGLAVTNSVSGVSWTRWCPTAAWKRPAAGLIELSTELLARWRGQAMRSAPLRRIES